MGFEQCLISWKELSRVECYSPLLFTVYLDDLLKELNGMFTGAFIYSDVTTSLAPSRQNISHVLSIRDNYTLKHDILFNPAKSKCMMCIKTCTPYSVFFKGQLLNFVDRCKLLGVSLSRDINDRHIQQTIHSFYEKKRSDVGFCYAFE